MRFRPPLVIECPYCEIGAHVTWQQAEDCRRRAANAEIEARRAKAAEKCKREEMWLKPEALK